MVKHTQRGFDADLKRAIAAGISMLLLFFMVTASATSAGTSTDPLISLSYLDGTFAASLKSEVSQMLGDAADRAMLRLDELFGNPTGSGFAPGFTRISIPAGDTIMLSMGGSFILLSGSAALTSVNGTVINISTGREAVAGSALNLHQRYFCVEETTAVITMNSASVGHVDGYYVARTAVTNRFHHVFRDVRESDWFFPAVDFAYRSSLFGGTAPNPFSPADSMTRAMFVTVLYRLEREPAVGSGGRYSDVMDASLYYYNAVTWANDNNIVYGFSDGTFGPNLPITREQMATFIYRYAEYKQRSMSVSDLQYNTFPDRGDVSGYAADAMRWAVSWGVIGGSNGMLLPRSTATRAQVAQIIKNYAEI